MQDYKHLLNQKIDAALSEQKFDKSLIHDNFQMWLYKALQHQTEYTLKCAWSTFEALINKSCYDFNLLEMCNALNAIEYTTAIQFDYSLVMYVEIKNVIKGMAIKWEEEVAPIKLKANEEVQAIYEEDLKKANAKNKLLGQQPLPKKQIFKA